MRFVPSWFPGAGFKKLGSRVGLLLNQIREVPFGYALKEAEKRGPDQSFASDMIEEYGPIQRVKDALGVLYSGMYLKHTKNIAYDAFLNV